ncbi:unnamed protein product [Toxocara canis]|uniref:Uncharacterized protein n=1 Tax=Toxocara canis TaxID=6265 RepID=A0A183VDJ0_TOXCA|nr:unnamed protein product [Toxocara canis]
MFHELDVLITEFHVSPHDDRPSFHTFGRHYEYSYESPERPGEKPNIKFKYGVLPDQVISTINDDLLTLPRWESKNSRREEVRRAPPVNIPQFPFPLPPNTASSTSSASTSYNRKDDNNGWENERLMSAKYDESFEAPDNEYHSRQYPLSSYSDNVIRDGERASRRAQMEYENVKSITDDLFHRAQQQMAEFNAFATPKIFSDISMAPNPWFTSVPQRYNNMDKYENRPDPTKRRLRFNSNQIDIKMPVTSLS